MLLLLLRPFGRALVVAAVAVLACVSLAGGATVVDRDEFSTTVDLGGGKRSTTLSSEPLNFQADSGAWQPLDLVLEPAGDGDLHPGGVDGDVAIPDSLAEPVELEHDGRSASFRLLGAVGEADVDGAEAGFDRAMPGVNVSYVARAYGVKETLELLSASAPRVFAYDLRGGASWSASLDRGDVVLRDGAGVERYRISAPLAWDSAEDPAFTNALALSVSRVSAGRWRVTLRPDAAWLGESARKFPVFIDPDFSWSNGTTTFNGAQDCYLSGATQANYTFCAQTYLQTGWYNRPYRSIFKFDIAAAIPSNATVSSAVFKAYAPPATPHIAMGHKLHTITSDWDSSATWNNRKPGTPWSTAGGGGDISTNPALTGSSTTVQAYSAWYSWAAPLAAVQGWVNGSVPNYGFMLRSDNTTNIGNAYVWASTEASMSSQFPADSSKWPKLDVSWTAPSPDQVAPQLALSGPLASLGDAWTKEPSVDLTVAATDAGSGVTQLELRKGSTTLGSQSQTCSAGGCSLTKTFAVDLAALGEGTHTLTVVGIDAAGNARSQDLTVRADRGPPAVELTGSLVDLQQTPAASGSRAVHVSATDPASGVTQLSLKVDGAAREQAQQPCAAAGGCSMTADWSIDLAGLSDGTHTVTITATDASGRDTTRELTVRKDGYVMPQAPPLSTTAVDPFIEQVDWLWTGSSPLQTGVAAGTITARRAAVITGNVFNEDGDPAGGITVSVVDHPEFGSTKSRSNGKYFLGVNGGQEYRLRFDVQGAVSAERVVQTTWADYAAADDVWMVALDPKATTVAFGAAATDLQVAEATPVSDGDGTRTTRVLVRPGTQAWTEHTDGSTTPLVGGSLRVSEFTVGENGPERMPAELPDATDYTWAADFRIDQASGPDDAHVRFSKPTVIYIDNFVGNPVGLDIPNGSYNEQTGKWEGEPDGRVIKVIGVDTAGRAILDVTGFGAASQAELDYFSIDTAELEWLAQTYSVGKTLWRTEAVRFSWRDENHGRWRKKKRDPKARPKSDPCVCNEKPGSILGVETQTLGEVADLGGTPYSARYESSRTPGAQGARSVMVPLTDETVEPDLLAVQADVLIAGQRLTHRVESPAADESHIFRWNGKDAFDRPMVGGAMADVTIHRIYDNGYYGEPGTLAAAGTRAEDWEWVSYPFTSGGASVSWGVSTRGGNDGDYVSRVLTNVKPADQPVDRPNLECTPDESQCWYPVTDRTQQWKLAAARDVEDNAYHFSVPLAYADARSFGVGGWTISDLHRYDTATGTLFTGDGGQRAARDIPDVVSTVRTVNGTDNPQELQQTPGVDIAALPDGSTLRADPASHRILRDDPTGHTTVFAGSADRIGSSGDGGLATDASLIAPQQLAVAPDGSVYVTDSSAMVVRKIDPAGVISTVAGNGTNGGSFTNGPRPRKPLQRNLYQPSAIDVAPDGTVYIGDRSGLFQLTPSGDMTQIGAQYIPNCGNPQLAECLFYSPPVDEIAVAPDGTVYWTGNAGTIVTRTFRWTPGTEQAELVVAANTSNEPHEGPIGDSDIAPRGLEFDAQGQLWIIAEKNNESTVWKLQPDGRVVQAGLAGCREHEATGYRYTGEGGPFRAACGETFAIDSGPDGMYLLENSVNIQIRKVTRAIPRYPVGTSLIPSVDGSEAYEFNASGRHTATLDGLTGRIVRTFTYDGEGRITAINETDYGTTQVAYTAAGATVTGPDGQTTQLEIGQDGYATKITDAAAEHQSFQYAAGGLLTSMTDELGHTSTFTWNAVGRLLSDTTPLGHAQSLARTENSAGTTVTHSDATGVDTTYSVADDGTGTPAQSVTAADGTKSTATTDRSTGISSRTSPDGTVTTTQSSGDARWGGEVSRQRSEVTLPSGKKLTVAEGSQVARNSSQNTFDPFDFDSITDTYTVGSRTWTSTYDKATRTSQATTPMGRTDTVTYDEDDRPVTFAVPGRQDVEVAYDLRGRPVSVSQGDAVATIEYGTDGRVQRTVDPEGGAISVVRDALGQPTQITAADGSVTALAWDDAGRLTSLQAPDGRQFTFAYDADGRLISEGRGARPGSGQPVLTASAQYDSAGRPTLATRASGETIASSYDTAGRATQAAASDGTSLSYDYEPVSGAGSGGRLSSASTGEGAQTAFEYDGSLPTSVASQADAPAGLTSGGAPSVLLGWDSQLRPASQTIDGDAVSVTYNDDDQPVAVGPLTFGYDAANGDPMSIAAGVTSTALSLDVRGDLAAMSHAASGTPVFSEQVVRDRLGRITRRTETGDAGTHVYDYAYGQVGELTQVTRDGAAVESYTYDVSRGLASRGAGVLVSAFTTDGHGRPVSSADGTSASWNADGELQTLATTTGASQLAYDGFGRLTQVTLPDGKVGRYRYDALGRRTAVTLDGQLVRRLVYGASLWPQARIDAAGDVLERYVYASQAHVPDVIARRDGQRIRLVTDATGSVRAAVDADTGLVLQRLSYDAYGRETQNTNPGLQPFGYKGAFTDPVAEGAGLVWMGVRAYTPKLARFTTPDPIGLKAGWNEHDALAGDPINLIDADGATAVPIPLPQAAPAGVGLAARGAAKRVGGRLQARGVAVVTAAGLLTQVEGDGDTSEDDTSEPCPIPPDLVGGSTGPGSGPGGPKQPIDPGPQLYWGETKLRQAQDYDKKQSAAPPKRGGGSATERFIDALVRLLDRSDGS